MSVLDSIREDQSAVSLTVDGRKAPFNFSTREGGDTTSEESKTYPGAMAGQKAHGGPQSVENVTLEGEFIPQQDHDMLRWLRSRCGKGDCVITEQLLDVDGVAFGRPDTWTGKLMSVSTGNYDARSGEPRKLSVEVSTDGTA